jgi:hypothetical protein
MSRRLIISTSERLTHWTQTVPPTTLPFCICSRDNIGNLWRCARVVRPWPTPPPRTMLRLDKVTDDNSPSRTVRQAHNGHKLDRIRNVPTFTLVLCTSCWRPLRNYQAHLSPIFYTVQFLRKYGSTIRIGFYRRAREDQFASDPRAAICFAGGLESTIWIHHEETSTDTLWCRIKRFLRCGYFTNFLNHLRSHLPCLFRLWTWYLGQQ